MGTPCVCVCFRELYKHRGKKDGEVDFRGEKTLLSRQEKKNRKKPKKLFCWKKFSI